MLNLISCYQETEKLVVDQVITDAVDHIKCIFPGHYGTTVVLNRHHLVLSTLLFSLQDNIACVWELSVSADEPLLQTNMINPARNLEDIMPDIIHALRKLQFKQCLSTLYL